MDRFYKYNRGYLSLKRWYALLDIYYTGLQSMNSTETAPSVNNSQYTEKPLIGAFFVLYAISLYNYCVCVCINNK